MLSTLWTIPKVVGHFELASFVMEHAVMSGIFDDVTRIDLIRLHLTTRTKPGHAAYARRG